MARDSYVESIEDMFSETLNHFVSGVSECSVYAGNVELVDDAALDRFALLSNKVISSILLADMYIGTEKFSDEIEQELLLSWVVLGAATEYALAIFLAIYPEQSLKHIPEVQGIRHRKIEDLSFDDLIKFYQGVADLPPTDIETLLCIKNNRNAVHLIKHKELASWKEYKLSVECFFSLLQTLLVCLPDLSDAKENYIQVQREIESMCR